MLASLVAQLVKNLPAMWETCVGSLGGEDPLEEGMAAHSSVLVWRILWTEESGGLPCTGLQSQTRLKQLSTHAVFLLILDVFAFFFYDLCSEKLPIVPAFFYIYCFLLLLLPITTAITTAVISASFFIKATLGNSWQS